MWSWVINGYFENQQHDTQFSNDKGADAKALSTEKKTQQIFPFCGGKKSEERSDLQRFASFEN